MSAIKEKTRATVEKYRRNDLDTGSPEVQVALLTDRIRHLIEHLKTHRKDHATRRGLMMLVGQRSRLLRYLKSRSFQRYRDLIASLGLRK